MPNGTCVHGNVAHVTMKCWQPSTPASSYLHVLKAQVSRSNNKPWRDLRSHPKKWHVLRLDVDSRGDSLYAVILFKGSRMVSIYILIFYMLVQVNSKLNRISSSACRQHLQQVSTELLLSGYKHQLKFEKFYPKWRRWRRHTFNRRSMMIWSVILAWDLRFQIGFRCW